MEPTLMTAQSRADSDLISVSYRYNISYALFRIFKIVFLKKINGNALIRPLYV